MLRFHYKPELLQKQLFLWIFTENKSNQDQIHIVFEVRKKDSEEEYVAMLLTETQIYHHSERIIRARNSMIEKIPDLESILTNITFYIDEGCGSACANSKCIRFGPTLLDNLSDSELEFVMIHEIMHIALNHNKCRAGRSVRIYNIACDIVVNSIVLEIYNNDISKITLNKYGEAVHTTPDGREGRGFSVDEVYEMLVLKKEQKCA